MNRNEIIAELRALADALPPPDELPGALRALAVLAQGDLSPDHQVPILTTRAMLVLAEDNVRIQLDDADNDRKRKGR